MTNLFQHLTTKNAGYPGSTKVDHLHLSFHGTPTEGQLKSLLDLIAGDNARGLATGNPQRVNNLQHLFDHDGGHTRKAMFLLSQLRDAEGRQVYKLSHAHGEATIQLVPGSGAPTTFAEADLMQAPSMPVVETAATETPAPAAAPAAPQEPAQPVAPSVGGEADGEAGQNPNTGSDSDLDKAPAPAAETQTGAAPTAEGASTDAGTSEGSESKDEAPVTTPEPTKTDAAPAAPVAPAKKPTPVEKAAADKAAAAKK